MTDKEWILSLLKDKQILHLALNAACFELEMKTLGERTDAFLLTREFEDDARAIIEEEDRCAAE